jgi:hypothetical protein
MTLLTQDEFNKLMETQPEIDQIAVKKAIETLRNLNFVKDLSFRENHKVTIEVEMTDNDFIDRDKSRQIYTTEWELLRSCDGNLNIDIMIMPEEE